MSTMRDRHGYYDWLKVNAPQRSMLQKRLKKELVSGLQTFDDKKLSRMSKSRN